jgi:hypothetical protein
MSTLTFYRTAIVLRDRTTKTIAFVLALVSLSVPLFVFSGDSSAGPVSGRPAGSRGYESSYTRPSDHLSPREHEQAREALRREFGLDDRVAGQMKALVQGGQTLTIPEWAKPIAGSALRSRGGQGYRPYDRFSERPFSSEAEPGLRKFREKYGIYKSPLDRFRENYRDPRELPPLPEGWAKSFQLDKPNRTLKPSESLPKLREISRLSSLHSFFEEGFRETVKNLADNGKSAEEGKQLLVKDVLDKSFESSSTKSTDRRPRGMNEKRQKVLLDVALREFSKEMKDAQPELQMSRDSTFDLRLKK